MKLLKYTHTKSAPVSRSLPIIPFLYFSHPAPLPRQLDPRFQQLSAVSNFQRQRQGRQKNAFEQIPRDAETAGQVPVNFAAVIGWSIVPLCAIFITLAFTRWK